MTANSRSMIAFGKRRQSLAAASSSISLKRIKNMKHGELKDVLVWWFTAALHTAFHVLLGLAMYTGFYGTIGKTNDAYRWINISQYCLY